MTPTQLYHARVEVTKEYFDIDFDTPRLFWIDEHTYGNMAEKNPRLKSKAGFIFGSCIFIRTIYKESPFLEYYFDHELGHFAFSQLSERDRDEYFADMYAIVQEFK